MDGSQPLGKPNELNLIVDGLAGVAVNAAVNGAVRAKGDVVQEDIVAGQLLQGRESGYR